VSGTSNNYSQPLMLEQVPRKYCCQGQNRSEQKLRLSKTTNNFAATINGATTQRRANLKEDENNTHKMSSGAEVREGETTTEASTVTPAASVVKLYVARHAERAAFDHKGRWSYSRVHALAKGEGNSRVWWDDPLTVEGKKQAAELGQQIPYISRVLTSPFVRCAQTALAVAKFHNVSSIGIERCLCENLIKEWFDKCPFERIMLNEAELHDFKATDSHSGFNDGAWSEELKFEHSHLLLPAPDDYETHEELKSRASDIVDKIMTDPLQFADTALVTHGGIAFNIVSKFRSLEGCNTTVLPPCQATYAAFAEIEIHLNSTIGNNVEAKPIVKVARPLQSPYRFTAGQDWCTMHQANWYKWFKQKQSKFLTPTQSDGPLRVLEIGSWEGLSASWFALNLLDDHPESRMTCIDHFDGMRGAGKERYDKLCFNLSLTGIGGKVSVLPYFSYPALTEHVIPAGTKYDLIYVDGDHSVKGVLEDAMLAWKVLREGGLMLLDDYQWPARSETYPHNPISTDADDHPKRGIDAFLAVHASELEVLHKHYQVLVRKVADTGFNFPHPQTEVLPSCVFIVNSNPSYIRGLMVTLKSLVDACPMSRWADLDLVVIQFGISPNAQATVEGVLPSNCTLTWIEGMAHSHLFPPDVDISSGRIALYAKLCLPQLLPGVKRVLYLDCDILVRHDVFQLLDTKNTSPLMAVRDFGYPAGHTRSEALTFSPSCSYFNAGVMLLDLTAMEMGALECLHGQSMIDFLHTNGSRLQYLEQDILNVVYHGKWKPLPNAWNVQGLGTYLDNCKLFAPHERQRLCDDPSLIHFTGKSHVTLVDYFSNYGRQPTKPWCYLCKHPFKSKWFDVLESCGDAWRPAKEDLVCDLQQQFKTLLEGIDDMC